MKPCDHFLEVVVLLNKFSNRSTDIDDLEIESLRYFFYEDRGSAYELFADLFDDIDEFKIVGRFNNNRNQSKEINKIVGFVYTNIMKLKNKRTCKGQDTFLQFFRHCWLFNFH